MRSCISILALLLVMTFVAAQDSPALGFQACASLLPVGYEYKFSAEITIDARDNEATFRDGRFGIGTEV